VAVDAADNQRAFAAHFSHSPPPSRAGSRPWLIGTRPWIVLLPGYRKRYSGPG
jgi:hypothetical protein